MEAGTAAAKKVTNQVLAYAKAWSPECYDLFVETLERESLDQQSAAAPTRKLKTIMDSVIPTGSKVSFNVPHQNPTQGGFFGQDSHSHSFTAIGPAGFSQRSQLKHLTIWPIYPAIRMGPLEVVAAQTVVIVFLASGSMIVVMIIKPLVIFVKSLSIYLMLSCRLPSHCLSRTSTSDLRRPSDFCKVAQRKKKR